VVVVSAQAFSIRSDRAGAVARLTPLGELDIATVALLREAFDAVCADQAAQTIVIDLTELSFMDSTGLRLVLEMSAACADADRLRVIDGSASVERLLDLVGVRGRLPIIRAGDDPRAPLHLRPG
jgi:anti-sigma B factor antagonist